MFWNYLKIALRNLRKNKLFSVISILGLTIGMTIFVFGDLVVKYEGSHDLFFKSSDRIYTVGTMEAAVTGSPTSYMNSSYSALGPIIDSELSDVDAVVRTWREELLLATQDYGSYENILFVDADFLTVFDFTYLQGDNNALEALSGLVITEAIAIKYFGHTQVIGETMMLDKKQGMRVAAVIEDIPKNSHFYSPISGATHIFSPLSVLPSITGFEIQGNWNNLSFGNITYVMLPENLNREWLQVQLDGIFERVLPEEKKEFIAGFFVEPLKDANLVLWNMMDMPVMATISLLSMLVLVIACANYSNLAVAQSMGRGREVGMRKSLGASQSQLLLQFLIESVFIAAIAMFAAIAILEILIPIYNNQANKAMSLDYGQMLPKLAVITLFVGVMAGAYPAWVIAKYELVAVLRDNIRKGKKGERLRALMIGSQFAISAFMLAVVAVVYAQGEKMQDASQVFPRSQVYTLHKLDAEDIRARFDRIKYELEALPNVETVAFSSQVPFQQSNNTQKITATSGDIAAAFMVNKLRMTPDFLTVYNIPLLAGRNLNTAIANDEYDEQKEGSYNVLINEMTMTKLGINSPEEAINQRYFHVSKSSEPKEFIIVGVVPTQNILGLFNEEKPWVFLYRKNSLDIASVKVTGNVFDAVGDIERVWKDVIPDYPIEGKFLDDVFDQLFIIFRFFNAVLSFFALTASALAMFGLFGLAAFMAKQRTREIGIRKVLGASSKKITLLLIFQFSKPVILALLVALPAAFFASNLYLNFFSNRLDSIVFILLSAGIFTVMLAWLTVAGQAYKVARANPIAALRHE